MTQPTIKAAKHYWELDYVRFAAACAVVALHYLIRGFAAGDTISPFHFPEAGRAVQYFYLAVNLFFMISGFVIFISAEKFIQPNSQTRRKNFLNFIRSRVIRLYPAFWICCTTTYLAVVFFGDGLIKLSLARYLANLTMLNGLIGVGDIDGPYWTLLIELKFYFLIGLLILTGTLNRPAIVISALTAVAASNLAIDSKLLEKILFTSYLPYFCAGASFYLLKTNRSRLTATALLAANFLIGFAYDSKRLIEKELHYGFEFTTTALAIYLAAFYLLFSIIGKTGAVRAPRLAATLGAASYPLYLIHNHIGMILFNKQKDFASPWIVVSITTALIVIASLTISKYLEPKLANKLGDLWKKH